VRITNELLLHNMHFPEGTQIRNARMSDDGRSVELLMEHDALLAVEPANEIPLTTPSFRRQPEVVFEGWNQ
jgi:hypothetical protein